MLQIPDAEVALTAQKSSHLAGEMTVIDDSPSLVCSCSEEQVQFSGADGTATALIFVHGVPLVFGDAVPMLDASPASILRMTLSVVGVPAPLGAIPALLAVGVQTVSILLGLAESPGRLVETTHPAPLSF